jgi:hypothetical protein
MNDTLAKVLQAVLSGLVVPILLEIWRSRRAKSQQNPTPLPVPFEPARPRKRSFGRAFGRLTVALFSGFIGSALLAAILENNGNSKIEFGSALMILLMILCTLLTWIFLSRIGPLKVRT